jgi:hypothetical protein
MKAALGGLFLVLLGILSATLARAQPEGPSRRERVSAAITEIDLERAERLFALGEADSPAYLFERARWLVYRGDCDAAAAMLANPVLAETREGASLGELARSCAKATVGGFVLEDKERGVWLRLQDDADRVLAPFIFDVAARARDAITRDLGVDMPRPLRIDLVRDLFSLSAVSGLPLSAAQTTGTLAVARWGRVILLSPRATRAGYPWEDTLAHEITHLIVSRATRDHAPLWLQEGMAKREEGRWREPRPFEDPDWAETAARAALRSGRSVGIDKLGPSIAMLPTPEAASIAFAEVTSFVRFLIEQTGEAGLQLLFADLRGVGDEGADAALRSVTGYDLSAWNQRWMRSLSEETGAVAKRSAQPSHGERGARGNPREVARRVRISDLLLERGHVAAADNVVGPAAGQSPRDAFVRHRAARTKLALGDRENAAKALGTETEFGSVHGPWFALRGRLLREAGDASAAESSFRLGIALDPLSEEVACEGHLRIPNFGQDPPWGWAGAPTNNQGAAGAPTNNQGAAGAPGLPLPANPDRRALCASARSTPQD